MVDTATSQQNLRAIAWLGSSTEEEGRAYLQQRLELLSKLMFWSFAALIAFIKLMYWRYPVIEPARNAWIMGISVGGLVVLAAIWRLGLARKPLDLRQLRTVDTFYAVSTGLAFGAAAYLSSDLQVAPLSCLLYSSFMVLLRAIVVPSTGSRTAVVGSLTFLPIVVAAFAISLLDQQPLPGPAYVAGALLVGTVVVMLATVGSRIIYGLRLKFSAAMQLGQYTLMHKILAFAGGKLLVTSWIKIPPLQSVAIIATCLAVSVILSLRANRRDAARDAERVAQILQPHLPKPQVPRSDA